MSTTTKHPVVFIHGVMGFGNHKPFWNKCFPYWPEAALQRLQANFLMVDVGMFSSDHDRACEAFFQLYGGRVDYGEEHAKHAGHCRYGEMHSKPLYPGWSAENPVHLIGHSLGATTAVELYQLICEDAFGVGTNSKWVKSIIGLAGPFSGSTMGHVCGLGLNSTTKTPLTRGHAFASFLASWAVVQKQFPALQRVIDYRMPQWESDISWWGIFTGKASIMASPDLAAYDLLPAQRRARNQQLKHMDEIYLVSIASSTFMTLPKTDGVLLTLSCIGFWVLWFPGVHVGPVTIMLAAAVAILLGRRFCRLDHSTSPILIIMRMFMWWGSHLKFHVYDGFDRQAWKQTDGVVNIYSMLHPMICGPSSSASTTKQHTHSLSNHDSNESNTECDSDASTDSDSDGSAADISTPLHLGLNRFHPSHGSDSRSRPARLVRGRWYVDQVNKNHFLGTSLDQDADNLYAKLLHLVASEFES